MEHNGKDEEKKKVSSTPPSIPYGFDTGREAHPVRQDKKPRHHKRSHGMNPEPPLIGSLHLERPNLRKGRQIEECEGQNGKHTNQRIASS